jgi:uncharacterized protein (DUF2141 family)
MMVLVVSLIPARAEEAVTREAAPHDTATLAIRIYNVSPNGGMLRLGLYDAKSYPDNDSTPVASADVPAMLGENVIVLEGVAPGTYAVQTFQDINSNGEMDTSWFGFPLEPFGFSRDARPHFSKPGFKAVSFHLAAGDNEQSLHLQNSISLIALKDEPLAGY